jgi:hypothetical protein
MPCPPVRLQAEQAGSAQIPGNVSPIYQTYQRNGVVENGFVGA